MPIQSQFIIQVTELFDELMLIHLLYLTPSTLARVILSTQIIFQGNQYALLRIGVDLFYAKMIILLKPTMHVQKQRRLQYSSLLIGGRLVPPKQSYSSNRSINVLGFKSHMRRNDLHSAKSTNKTKRNLHLKNKRPDIFLEGQQFMAVLPQFDPTIFEKIKSRIANQFHGHNYNSSQSHNRISNQPTSLLHNRVVTLTKVSKDQNLSRLKHSKPMVSVVLQSKTQARRQLFYMKPTDLVGIKAQSFIVMEYPTEQVITGLFTRKVSEIASLTKIMTLYAVLRVIREQKVDIDRQWIEIDEHASVVSGTSADLFEGDVYTVRQLLYGLMLPSGNDAAVALAKWAGQYVREEKEETCVKAFIALMNRIAGEIGMKNSTFCNPHGLPHCQSGSTAEDVAVLCCRGMGDALFREVVSSRQYRCWVSNGGVKREIVWENTNKLLRRRGFYGVKTGVTVTAGPCLATYYEGGDRKYVIVVLRASKLSRRFKETRLILSGVLRRIDCRKYGEQIEQLMRNDAELDSDNSEDEKQFNFTRSDTKEMEKRVRILQNQL